MIIHIETSHLSEFDKAELERSVRHSLNHMPHLNMEIRDERDFVMTAFRSKDLDRYLTEDDRIELFEGILPGSSDLTVGRINDLLRDYECGYLVEVVNRNRDRWVIDLMYRCGGNFKTPIRVITEDPKAADLKTGDEIRMGQFGSMTEAEFFSNYPYDPSFDHNILEVLDCQKIYWFNGDQVVVKVSTFHGAKTIELIEAESGERYLTATSFSDWCLTGNEVAIKDYSENQGVREFLETAGFIGPVKRTAESGYASLSIHDVLKS